MKRIGVLRQELDTHPFIYSLGFRFKPESNFQYRKLRENEINELMRKITIEEERSLRILRTKQIYTLEKSGVNTSNLDLNVKYNQPTLDVLNIAASLAVTALDVVVNGNGKQNNQNNQHSVNEFDIKHEEELPRYEQVFPLYEQFPSQFLEHKQDPKQSHEFQKSEYIFPIMEEKFNCRRCHKEFDSFKETINHQNTICKNPKKNIEKFNCRRCNKEFDSFEETIHHQNIVCKNPKKNIEKFNCRRCNKEFDSFEETVHHQNIICKNQKPQNKVRTEHIKNDGNTNKLFMDEKQKIYIKEKIPPTVRNSIWNRHIGAEKKIGMCTCCNTEQISFATFQCGHVQSEKEGGKVTLQNLRPICAQCNSSMGIQNMEDFMNQYGYKKYANWYCKEEGVVQ